MPRRAQWLRSVAIAALVLAAVGVLAGCGDDDASSFEASSFEASSGFELANADPRNSRWVEGEIDSSNVAELGEAWTVPIEAAGRFGGYSATPVVVDGVAYTQDLDSNVFAIDVESGETLWSQEYDSPTAGPNGVTVAEDKVFGATATDAFALDAETGDELWRTDELIRNDSEGIDMAPGYNDGTVYVSTVPGNTESFYAGNGQGVLWALDAETGEEVWTFDTVPEDLWGKPEINSGGGLWHAPAFDEEGDVYAAIANPAPWPGTKKFSWAKSRPGPNLYSNSCVKLDGETGELEWHFQALPHDLYDWDLQIGPILTELDGRQIVLCAGKLGYVYGIDQESGELLWERSVGRHNGHDDDNQLALDGQHDQLPEPPYELLPGFLGGVLTQMAVNESTVFAPVNNLASTVESPFEVTLGDPSQGTGEMVALDIASGEVEWQHEFDSSPYGSATVVNDLVFTTTFDGTLWALNTETGEVELELELPAGTNAPVTIAGDTAITAGSFPQGADEESMIVAYRLGAESAEGKAGEERKGARNRKGAH